ncbi:hypothetical protein GQ55_6G192800 [Panicum hallii var. hallii]|uniref:Uncharacterized protein n=1 Tax=Panicum hallii var. hallii TaxID=1504633 RepID=A0A2T7D7E1_9POAL|nr:hypothetical protein GQ55_6G192800 [Panicum hallii var. hallii]
MDRCRSGLVAVKAIRRAVNSTVVPRSIPHAPVLLYPGAAVRGPRSGAAPCSCRSRHAATSSLLTAAWTTMVLVWRGHESADGGARPLPSTMACRRPSPCGAAISIPKQRLLRVRHGEAAGPGLREPQRQLTLPPATRPRPQTHGSTPNLHPEPRSRPVAHLHPKLHLETAVRLRPCAPLLDLCGRSGSDLCPPTNSLVLARAASATRTSTATGGWSSLVASVLVDLLPTSWMQFFGWQRSCNNNGPGSNKRPKLTPRMRPFVHSLRGKGKKDVSSSSRSQGKKNDGFAFSDRPSLFRGSSSHLSRKSALQRCLDEAMQQEEEGRGADEEEYVTNVDGDGDGDSGDGDGCEDREECEDGDGDAEEEEEEDTAAQPVFRFRGNNVMTPAATNPANRRQIRPHRDWQWDDICWEGRNRLTPVNATLGTLCRFHYPGMVTIGGVLQPALKWEHYKLQSDD